MRAGRELLRGQQITWSQFQKAFCPFCVCNVVMVVVKVKAMENTFYEERRIC